MSAISSNIAQAHRVSIRSHLPFPKKNMSLPVAMDLSKIRKTEDGKVSVIDVIVQIKKCKGNYAAQVYQRLLEEERVPKCEVRNVAHTTSGGFCC